MNWNNLHSLFVFNSARALVKGRNEKKKSVAFGIFQEKGGEFGKAHCEREHRAEMTGEKFCPRDFLCVV
jgi:hypothetical protein